MRLEILKRVDILGEPVNLSIGGQDAHQTYIGAILSFFYITLTIVAIVKIAMDYFDTTNPSVVQTTQESFDFPKIDMFENEIVYSFYLFDENQAPVLPSQAYRYFTGVAVLFESVYDPSDITYSTANRKTTLIPMIPCYELSQEKIDSLYSHVKKDERAMLSFMKYGICLDPPKDKYYVKGRITDIEFSMPTVYIQPCQSSLNDCMSGALVAKAKLYTLGSKNSMDVSNFKNPISPVPTAFNMFSLNPTINLMTRLELKKNQIIDSSGFLFPEKVGKNYADIQSMTQMPDYRDSSIVSCPPNSDINTCPPYNTIQMTSSGTTVTIERSYKGLLESFGDVGGIKEVILIVVVFIYSFYHPSSQINEIVKKVYRTDEYMDEYVNFIKSGDGTSKSKVEERKIQENLEKTARRTVEEQLDVVSLIKEMNKLNMIVDILIDDKTKQISQLYCLFNQTTEKKNSSPNGAKIKDNRDSIRSDGNKNSSEGETDKEKYQKKYEFEVGINQILSSIINNSGRTSQDDKRNGDQSRIIENQINMSGMEESIRKFENHSKNEDFVYSRLRNMRQKLMQPSLLNDNQNKGKKFELVNSKHKVFDEASNKNDVFKNDSIEENIENINQTVLTKQFKKKSRDILEDKM